MKFTKNSIIVLVVLAVILIAARVALPYVVKNYINKTLQNDMEGYTGSIDDVDISLYRGAYAIDNFKILKTGGKVPVPFIAIDKSDISIEWRALLKGSIVAEVILQHPQVNFVDAPSKEQAQTGEEGNWQETLENIIPLDINRLEVQNGDISFKNFSTKPDVDLHINKLSLIAHNLRNSYEESETLPATVKANAVVLDNGNLKLDASLNPLQTPILFKVATEITDVNLTKLNTFMEAYGGIDVEKGKLDVYTELNGSDTKFEGYIKPLLTDVKVLDIKEDATGAGELIWEGFVGVLNMVFKNWSKDRLATKIPISGDLSNPDVNVWKTIVNILKNAFVEAIQPGLEGNTDLSRVGNEQESENTKQEEGKEAPTKVGRAYDKVEKKIEETVKDIVK